MIGIIVTLLLIALVVSSRPRWYLKLKASISKPVNYELSDFPEMQDFHDAYADIRQECEAVLTEPINHIHREVDVWNNSGSPQKTEEFLKKHEHIKGWVPAWAPGSSDANYKWLNFPLVAVGHTFDNNLMLCPKLAALLAKHKKIINICGFSLLKPGAELKTHVDTTGIQYNTMAYHLGLIVPEEGENNLIVNGQKFIQREGQSIVFESTYPHSANNHSSLDRIILYIDFQI